jgi:hypothetical protein
MHRAHVLAVDGEVDPPGPPVGGVRVLIGYADPNARRVEVGEGADDRSAH